MREYAVAMLGDLGYSVLEAAEAADAMRISERTPRVDLSSTDGVPTGGVSGRELAQQDLARKVRELIDGKSSRGKFGVGAGRP